ncbi:hypothetical protein GCM10009623_17620 [Nocardioides aestuarii]|uniref:FlgD Ig-like domain-containing protein n=1 Tax=Nocardioides aestuarii TaxID=252231 RepID=A0ABW4TLW3_9ACTN
MLRNHAAGAAHALITLAIAAALTVSGPGAAVAGDPVLEILDVDTSVPGHVAATVSTDAQQLRGILRRESGVSIASTGWFPVEDGTAVVEAETWGMRTSMGYVLEVISCTGTSTSGCATSSTSFVPTDVAPVVEFSDDDLLTGTEQATAVVHDEGGGELMAYYRGPFTGQLLHEGSQVLRLDHGANHVWVARCNGRLGCNSFGIEEHYAVDKGYAVGSTSPGALLPDGGPAADATVTFQVADTVPYTFRGHLLPSAHAATEGRPAVVAEDLLPVDGTISIPLDLTPLPDGGHLLVGELSRSTPTGPVVQWALARPPEVDREGPRFQFASLGADVFHPVRDGHLDEVTLSAHFYEPRSARTTLRVVHEESGTEVEVGSTDGPGGEVAGTWDGRTADGRLAPAGRWELRFAGVDELGNRTEAVAGELRLTHKRVVEVRQVFAVSARASRVDPGTSRCGRVVRDPGGWRGGLGYRTKPCGSRVSVYTSHELDVVPRGWLGGKVGVSALGRSAQHRPNTVPSEARLVLRSEWREPSRRMLAPQGWYSTRLVRRESDGDPVEWVAGVDGGAQRYDVRRFRVVFEGRALR